MIWPILICCIPFAVHLVNDAKGDNKKGNDIIVLTIIAGLLALVNRWLFDIHVVKSLALMAGIHVMLFDYAVNIIMFRNKIIEHPTARQWWKYCGKKSKLDLILSKIDWRVRLAVRLVILSTAIYFMTI